MKCRGLFVGEYEDERMFELDAAIRRGLRKQRGLPPAWEERRARYLAETERNKALPGESAGRRAVLPSPAAIRRGIS